MSLSRRRMLTIAGGGVVVAAASTGAFVATRSPTTAIASWDAAGTYAEPRRRALSYALLAPNPHNRQPWLVDLGTPDAVQIHRDKSKGLPETDPHSRQLTIGMGCFLELMVIAAAQTGHGITLDLFPSGEGGPVATARFHAGAARPDPLFSAVLSRRSTKQPFDPRPVASRHVAALAPYASIVTAPDKVAELVDLTWFAWNVEAATPRALKESVDLMRIGKAEIDASPDGIDLGGPMLESLAALGMLSRDGQLDPKSSQFGQTVALYDNMLHATPAYTVITTAGNSRADQIAAGRRWLRLNLAATSLGLSLHPVSQALQEYPEMKAHYARAHQLLASKGHTVQMLGRLGYGAKEDPSPRWPLEAKILAV